MMRQEHEEIFWGNENVLDLEEDVGYMGLPLSKRIHGSALVKTQQTVCLRYTYKLGCV